MIMAICTIVSVGSAFVSAVASHYSSRAAQGILNLEESKLKARAFAGFRRHTLEGMAAVLFAFRGVDNVVEALRNYNNAIKERRDNKIPAGREDLTTDPPTIHLFSRFGVATIRNRRQDEINKLYDKVIEAMCEDVGTELHDYQTILEFNNDDMRNRWTHPFNI